MADSNQLKRVDRTDFNENDPFAELTRIMGSDPRGHSQPVDDLGIDLEMELMGDFADTAEFTPQPASAPRTADSWTRAADAPSMEAQRVSPAYSDPVDELHQPSHGNRNDLNDADQSDWHASDAAPVTQADASISFDDDFDLSLDDELSSAFPADDLAPMPEEAPAEHSVWHASQWAAVEDALAQPTWQDDAPSVGVPASSTDIHAQSGVEATGEVAPEAFAENVIAYDEPTPSLPQAEASPLAEPDWLADVDMDFAPVDDNPGADAIHDPYGVATASAQGDAFVHANAEQGGTEPVLAAMAYPGELDAVEQAAFPPSADPVEGPHFEAQEMPQPMAPIVEQRQPSLEEELSALLVSDFPDEATTPPSPEQAYAEAISQDMDIGQAAEAPASEGWHPNVHTFGYADHRDEILGEPDAPVGDEFVAAGHGHDDWQAQPAEPIAAHHPTQAAGSGDHANDLDDEFAAIFADPDDDVPPAKPEPAFSGRAHAGTSFHPVLPSIRQAREDVPEVETISVAENVVPQAGEIDIPELNFEEEVVPRLYDDLEAEIAESFGDFGEPEPAPQTGAETRQDWDPDAVYAASAASVAGAMAGAGAMGHSTAAAQNRAPDWQMDDNAWQSSFQDDLAAEFDDQGYATDEALLSGGGLQDSASRPSRSRGLFVGAIVAGVVVVGGAGLFGASYLGGGSGEPVFISADTDPMKVRPENPGGAVVPNQDNEVYQRVAGGEQRTAPTQEQLISSAEEPVDVAARSAVPIAPGVSSGEEGEAAKSEDRMEPARDEAGLATGEVFVAVQPRRVRTMVVRPDGTIVPREEVVETAALADAPVANAPLADATTPDVTGAGTLPDPAIPNSVNVVPTSPSGEQQMAAAAAPAPSAPAAPVPAPTEATPASAPAAAAPTGTATSEWSMQIASQPSAESAQATYQDLARRYGGVLEGRGVNIVRAEIEGKGVYYRVRIPSSNRDDAIQLCTRYKSAGGSCFVSR